MPGYRFVFVILVLATVMYFSSPIPALKDELMPSNTLSLGPVAQIASKDTCDGQTPGDFNGDTEYNTADLVSLTAYVCSGGPPPDPLANGDPNGDCIIDSVDIDYLAQYIFAGGPPPVECTCVEPIKGECHADTCDGQSPGDLNGDDQVTVADMVYILSYLCGVASPPDPLANGDPNGDCVIDSNDVNYLKAYIYQGGPLPVECTCVDPITGDCPDTCMFQRPGDFNYDVTIDINDVNDLILYLCEDGPPPHPLLANGDPNGDCYSNFLDVNYLMDYLYYGGPDPVECTCNEPIKGKCQCDCIPGDANGDGTVNIGDAVHLIAYIFKSGPPPTPYPLCSGDSNCDCEVNVGDVVYIISYVFKSGPAPCDCVDWALTCGSPLRK